jgi:primosomal protein N' (replication factor Y) (superfamily II helicase)
MSKSAVQLEIAIALPVWGTFTYRVPPELLPAVVSGRRVLVPFGPRRVTGYVLGTAEESPSTELKAIIDVLDAERLFTEDMVPFFRWIADYYIYPLGEVIKGALPGGLNLYEFNQYAITEAACQLPEATVLNDMEREVLDCLKKGACRLKELNTHLDRPVPGRLLHAMERCGWVSRKKTMRGGRTRPKREKLVRLLHPDITGERLTPQRRAVLDVLARNGETTLRQLRQVLPNAATIVRGMTARGFVETREQDAYRDPFGESILPDHPPELTPDQQLALEGIHQARTRGFAPILLEGVTGSGKTEVYLNMVADTIARQKTALVLVPEIALISQMERRFRARFGENVAVLHSGLSAGERLDQWMRILRQEAAIVIGARSAIFAPLRNIGLIVVDEEHDPSYKQDNNLRYNARDLAVVRAKQTDCPVLLGSATPSVQTYHNTRSGRFTHIQMMQRVTRQSLPEVEIVNLAAVRQERGLRKHLTPELIAAIRQTLANGEQALLFLNRRGYANFPHCAACGTPVRCRHCSITLTYHRDANAYRCHYCGYSQAANQSCSACGASQMWHFGLGTEKLEEAMQQFFPEARTARMDRDTTRRKGSLLRILKDLQQGAIDILIGTQMVAKGHDFPNITLVGIVCADTSLNFPDFRSSERTFQLLAQVAGRAGRGERPGRVILQTYTPDHFTIAAAREQDFQSFYQQETQFRKELGYPPYSRMVQFLVTGKHRGDTRETAENLGATGRRLLQNDTALGRQITILGPVEAARHQVAGRFRWQLLIKGPQPSVLNRFARQVLQAMGSSRGSAAAKVIIDVDPLFMM